MRTRWESTPVVAIAGGGASGTLAAVHLLCRAGARPRVVIIDESGRHGRGVAYSTPDPAHLLNTPAAAMSAYAGDPGHLVRWASRLGLVRGGGDFLSRYAYGDYLRDTLAEQELRHGGVELCTDRVVAIQEGADGRPVLRLDAHPPLAADAVVLATGHLPQAPGGVDALFATLSRPGKGFRLDMAFPPDVVLPPHVRSSRADDGRYVADPWSMPPGPVDGDVLLIGTGLTMIDVAVSLTRDNPGITVHAVSRHGLVPHAHAPVPAQPAPPGLAEEAPGLAGLVRAVRTAVDAEDDWRAAVDGLRPRVPELWRGLSVADRRRFLDRVARYWEVHRHRMPYPTAQRVARLREEGRLRIHRGAVRAAEPHPAGVRVQLSGDRRLDVARVIRCTGPGGDVTAAPGLAATLVTDGVARPDPLRLGLDTDEDGALLGPYGDPHDRIFTLGPPRRGALYESTAVPEIRVQAERLAARVAALLATPREHLMT